MKLSPGATTNLSALFLGVNVPMQHLLAYHVQFDSQNDVQDRQCMCVGAGAVDTIALLDNI